MHNFVVVVLRHVKSRDVERGPEVLLAVVFLMEVVGGARGLVATRELRVGLCTARLTGVVGDASTLGAQRVQKGGQITVLPMVVVGGAVMRVALELPEENQDCVSGMVVGRDVKEKIAQRVQKASQVFASHMEVAADAKLGDAQKGHKGAQCFARLMVGGNGVRLQGVPKVLRGARLIARATVEGKDVHSKVGFVRRVCMEVPTSVWHMGVVKGVLCLSAQRVQGEGQIIVSVMVGGRDASLMGVAKVHKEAPIFARHMVEERSVLGAILDQNMAANLVALATPLPGGRQVSVLIIVAWFRIRGFMEVLPWDL
jgi:hypothetical protein